MSFFRLLLVVLMTLSACASVAMDAGHAAVMEHSHALVTEAADDSPVCCSDSTDRSQTCHLLPGLLPVSDLQRHVYAARENISFGEGLLLTGMDPSGPLDPPRVV